MTKKMLASLLAFVMVVALVIAIPAMATEVPDELKTDYVPTEDGNLIDTIPAGVEINCGDLPVSVSGNIATLTANALIGESSDWGMNGFHINKSFISTLPEGSLSEGPVLTQGTKVLFSVKVRKAEDATADAKINLAYASWYNVQYEEGSPIYTDNYPNVGDGFVVNSTEWTEFKTSITAPKDCGGNEWSMVFGLASGTPQGAKIEVDMSTMYLGPEIPYDIEVAPESSSVNVGDSTTVTATILNQMDDIYSGGNGAFRWYALTGDREYYADGITVSDNGDGTATVSVGSSVAAGTYTIVAESADYTGLIKGTAIEVASTSDYEPGDDGNLITTYPTNFVDINSDVACAVSGNIVTLTANSTVGTNSSWGMNGFEINERFIPTLSDGHAPVFSQATKVLISAKVRKAADATQDAKINVSYASWYNVAYEDGTPQYTDTYPNVGDGFLVNSTDWMNFKAVITVPASTDGNTWAYLFGLSSGTAAGAKVEVDMSTMYFGAETAYDIEVTTASDSVLSGSSTTAKATIINQIGGNYSGTQGGFNWYAMDVDRTTEVAGIEVLDNGNGTATVDVDNTVSAGTYVIVAVSDTYTGFVKGAEIEVKTLGDDYTPGDDGNLVTTYPTAVAPDTNGGGVTCVGSGNIATLSASSAVGTSSDWGIYGFEINERFIPTLQDGYAPIFSQETKVLISAKVRKTADSTVDPKINVSYSSWYAVAYEGWTPKYTDTYPAATDGFAVTSTDWMDFKAVITVPARTDGNTWAYLFGFANGTGAGAKVEIDMSSMYFGAEEIYDITNKSVGASAVQSGTNSTVTYKAQIVNQIGITSAIPQGTFTWYVMNEDKTATANGIEVIANANNTATVNVSASASAGTYTVVAVSNLYPDFVRSATLTVADGSVKYSIYVSPEGKDSNQGTLIAPLKTVQAAQQKARQYVAEEKIPLEVVFRGGDYYFSESLVFSANDSAPDGSTVTYRAYDGEEVRFKGSKELDLSKATNVTDSGILSRIKDGFKQKVLVIDLAEQGITASQICTPAATPHIYKLDYNREFNGFYINGKSMDVSCWPNGDTEATYTFDENDCTNKFSYTNNTAPDRWGSATNWWVTIFNSYDYIPLRMKGSSIDTANNVISVGVGGSEMTINNPYTPTWKAYNLLEEIDVGGEYYIDIDNMKLYFLPPCDLNGATAEFEVIGDPVIKLQNAKNITFSGIEFSQINDDGVVMTDVVNVDVEGCIFRDIGWRGLAVLGTAEPKTQQYATDDKLPYGKALGEVPTANDASYNMDIKNNIFYNTGSSAIHINGGNIDTLTPSNNIVENNSISKFAQHSYWDGVVVVGVGTKVRKNNISDSPYYGIRIYGNDHVIEYNEVYDVIKNSNDAAAIYVGASAIARGTKIQYNYIHDIKTIKETKNDWEVGIYLDDCQQGITVKNNIIADVHEGIWSNGAGDYTIDANTIINATTGIRFGYNADAKPGSDARTAVANRIYNKDVYYAKYPALQDYVNGTNPKSSSKANANIFCNVSTNIQYYRSSWFTGNINTCEYSLSQDKDATHQGNSTVASDVFVNPVAQDYRVNSANAGTYVYPLNETNLPDINAIGMTTNLTLNAETSPFTASYPVNGATSVEKSNNELWISWDDAFGATQYRVQVGTDSKFSSTLYDKVVYDSAADISGISLTNDTTYYWKITAINTSRDFGAQWTAEGSFKTLTTSIENLFVADDGTVTAEIHTYGNDFVATDAVCYIAAYGSNSDKPTLLQLVPQTKTLAKGQKYQFTGKFENFDKSATYSVKMFVWNNGYIPLVDTSATIIIPKNNNK